MSVSDADVVARLRLNAKDFSDDLRKAIGDAAKRMGDLDQGLRGVERGAARARAGQAQLGQQIQDVTIQAQMGTSAFVIFGQQFGQFATAASLMGGKLGAVGSFLAGPWGAAVQAAVIGLGVLYMTTRDAGDAQDGHAKAAKTNKEAIEDLAKASGLGKLSAQEELEATIKATDAKLKDALATRGQIAAKLAFYKALQDGPKGPRGEAGEGAARAGAAALGSAAVDYYTKLAAENDKAVSSLQDAIVTNRGYFQAAQAAAAATDASAAATQRYDRAVAAARKTFQDSNKTDADRLALTNALIAADREKTAAVEAAAKAKRGERSAERAGESLEARYEKEVRALEAKRLQVDAIGQGLTTEAAIQKELAGLRERMRGLDAARLADLEAQTREVVLQKELLEGIAETNKSLAKAFGGTGLGDKFLKESGDELDRIVKATEDAKFSAMQARWNEERRQVLELADFYEAAFTGRIGDIWATFKGQGLSVLSRLAAGFTVDGKTGLSAAISGTSFEALGNVAKKLFGGGDGQSKGLVGGLGKFLGAGSPLAGAVGAVSKALPYVGAAIQAFGLVKGVVGMFGPAPRATATITTGGGGATASSATGSKSLRDAAQKLGDAFAEQINRIAESLGADVVDGLTIGSIGRRGKDYTYDPTGRGRTKGAGVIRSRDQSVVELAAFKDAVSKGAIGGTSQTVLNALLGGTSIQDAQSDAGKVAQFLRDAKRLEDPLGAALDEIEDKFKSLRKVLEASGASAEEMAKFEALRSAEIKKATEEAAASLRDFRSSLNFGGSSPLSLRDQEKAALANYESQAARIGQAGFDQSKFVEAGRAYLDVLRQLQGSTEAYFAGFDRVQADTNRAISTIENAAPINPLEKATADATAATARSAASMDETLNQILATLQTGAASSSTGGSTSVASSFIGGSAGYLRQADAA